ncbi:MAG: NosD domain-containing protein, partial [Methanofollis sp.]|nr:NosD domain-containing protein [Methanofollis sp.]
MTVNPSASIQDAVDSATAGDVITVNAGTYDEDVTVDKRLTLRGEGNAIVNGGFLLGGAAAGATVENFIVNQGTDSVAINVNSVNDAVVRGCTVSGGIYGIYIQSATNCTVEGCTVSNVENNGIHLESAGQSQVLDNQVSGCGGGFSGFGILLYTNSPDCLISGNTVQGCTDRGIQIQSGCQGAVIESNICSGNNGGLRVSGCTGTPTVLRDNTVLGDHNTAVGLEGVDSVIVENVTARDGKNGIFLADAENITLTNSTSTGFTGYGLFVFSGSYATNSLIANNLFNNTQNVLIPDKSVTTGTRWNTTQTAGENIRGGPFLGGNLWLTPEGTGFSQTRADFDLDGICDEGYDLGNGCTDSLPLQNGGPSSAFSVTPSSAMVGVPLAFNDTSLGDPASWTWTFDEEDPITITDPADRNITRTYDTADTYQATLTVKNEFGTNATTRTLDVTPYTIQGAVDAAAPGDVVLVPSSTYEEDVTVDKNITLRGSENAVLNGRITIIGVDGATLEHLTVNGVEGDSAIELYSVSGCTVRDNTVTGGRYGIYLGCGSSDCLVSGNRVEDCSEGDISLSCCGSGNEFAANTCSGGNYGFEVESCTGPNTLRDNIALATNRAIQLNYPGSVVIENVTLKGGTDGVAHYGKDDLTLTNSTIAGFNHGLYFRCGSCLDHALIANNRFNNTNNVRIESGADLSNICWNTTKTKGTNIRGGSFLGGNLWLTPDGTGFSETHADFDLDGFCDEGYDLGNGCTDYLPLQNGGPSASFTVAPPTIMTGVPVSFNDTSVGDPTSWTWTFDGETETTRNVTHTYDTAGTHQATLTVKNEFGTNTTTCTLDVTPYTIQGAVDAAAPGDVVLVPAGEYTESVRVDKNITLRGSEGAVLNGRIKITSSADGATVEHLTVNGDEGDMPIYLSGVSGCTVRDNTVTGGYSGIYLCSGSSDCLVSGNHVEDYSQNGISLTECGSGNEVVANTCSGGCYGFHIEDCTGPNTLRDNTVFNANGINLPNPGPVVVENVTMHIKPGGRGVIFFGNDALTLTNSTITGAYQGLCLSPDSGLEHMLIANNLFNNTQNLHTGYGTDLSGTRWNTTKTEGTNIGGGPYLGGNLWLTPDGTGFSETHLDLDGDGICDESYDLGSGCTDHLPLHTCLPTANFTVTPAGGSTPLEV